MNTVSITVSLLDKKALHTAAQMFQGLAGFAGAVEQKAAGQDTEDTADQNSGGDDTGHVEHRSGHEIPEKPPAVDLDEEGLPWDVRIHGESKLKLKKEGTWKLKRHVDPVLVREVKDELRAALAAGPAKTEDLSVHNVDGQKAAAAATTAPTPGPAPAPAPAAAPAPAPKPAAPERVTLHVIEGQGYTRQQLLDAKWSEAAIDELATELADPEPLTDADTVTFPQILAIVAESTFSDAEILVALQAQGLESVEMLAVRPDLIVPFRDALFA